MFCSSVESAASLDADWAESCAPTAVSCTTQVTCWMLLVISPVVAVCSSAAVAIWFTCMVTSFTWSRMLESAPSNRAASSIPLSVPLTPCSIEEMAALVSCWMARIMVPISLVALVVRSARARTSSATTAKPRPCSPARAASMAAFSASRLVWSAMSSMVATIAPICSDLSPSDEIASAFSRVNSPR